MNTIPLQNVTGPHQGSLLAMLDAQEKAEAMLLLLHGRGATALSMLEMSSFLEIPPHMIVAAPEAQKLTWYPKDIAAPRAENQAHLDSASSVVKESIIEASKQGIPAEKVVIVGFSQGACIAANYLSQHPQKYGGVALLSGGLLGTDQEVQNIPVTGTLDDTTVLIGSDKNDSYVSKNRLEQSADYFKKMHASVLLKLYDDIGHGINEEELKIIQDMINNTDYSRN